jgi:CBS domain-containing protein
VPTYFFSELQDKPIRDSENARVAALGDMVVRLDGAYPPVTGLVARSGRRDFFVPWSQVADLNPKGVYLNSLWLSLERFRRRQGEILLRRDVMDRQIIDVQGRRVVRTNDLQLALVEGACHLVGVDVSLQGLLRRLGPPGFGQRLVPRRLIDWSSVEYVASEGASVHLNVTHDRLARLHPADLARIIEDLSVRDGAEILDSLDDARAADTLEEMDEEHQARILGGLDEERAADIIEEMAPDDAADLLADLPDEQARDLLSRMDDEEAAAVEHLLSYDEDSAGGTMTTDFVTLPPEATAATALAHLRTMEERPDNIDYLLVVSDAGALEGVVRLRDLALAVPEVRVDTLVQRDIPTVGPDEPLDEAVRTMTEYNLLALPVIADDGKPLGIVTVDDALDRAFEGWRPERRHKIFG